MDGFPRPSQQNQPIPPVSQLPTPPYRRQSTSQPLQFQTQNGQPFPVLPVPSQTNYPQYYIPDIVPRNLVTSASQPHTVMGSQYPQFNYPSIYGNNAFHPSPLQSSVVGTQTSIESNRLLPGSQVPEWQPDHLVRNCPICGSLFTIFNRRHHCRKCGRVVCAPCSSFKILLPSSDVVRNPTEGPSSNSTNQMMDNYLGGNGRNPYLPTDPSSITSGAEQTNYGQSWTGGFLPDVLAVSAGLEEVRSCRDCKAVAEQDFLNSAAGIWNQPITLGTNRLEPVADPWAPSPASAATISTGSDGNSRRRRQSIQGGRSLPYTYNPEISSQVQTTSTTVEPNVASWSNAAASTINPQALSHQAIQHRYQQPSLSSSSCLVGQGGAPTGSQFVTAMSNIPMSIPPTMSPQVPTVDSYQQNLRRVEESMRSHGRYTPAQQSPHSRPRPHIPPTLPTHLQETDFCPICTRRLPPVHPETGDETEREEHIQECIRAAESSTSPRRDQTGYGSSQGPDNPSSSVTTVDLTGSWRAGGGKGGGRMVVYRATEIDTWDFGGDSDEDNYSKGGDDYGNDGIGTAHILSIESIRTYNSVGSKSSKNTSHHKEKTRKKAECVICFEEFEVGQSIARLECLCRYHKTCIRAWFDRKGNGECPVHAVRE